MGRVQTEQSRRAYLEKFLRRALCTAPRVLASAACWWLISTSVSSARAGDGAEFSLHWQAPAGCSDEASVRERVLALVGAQAPVEVRAHATVTKLRSGYEMQLVTFRAGQRGQRELVAPSCPALVEAVTVILALAIDPELFTRAPEGASTGDAALPDALAPGEEPLGDAQLSGPPGQPPQTEQAPDLETETRPAAPQRGAHTEDVAVERSSATFAPLASSSAQDRPRVFASLVGGVESGAMPGVGFGMSVRAGGSFGRLRLETQLSRWLSRQAEAADSRKGAELTLSSVAVWVCVRAIPSPAASRRWRPRPLLIEAGPCAGGELGRLEGSGFGIPFPTRGSSDHVGTGGALRIAASPASWLRLDLRFEAVALLHRPMFFVEGLGPVYRPEPWSLRAALGTEVLFP